MLVPYTVCCHTDSIQWRHPSDSEACITRHCPYCHTHSLHCACRILHIERQPSYHCAFRGMHNLRPNSIMHSPAVRHAKQIACAGNRCLESKIRAEVYTRADDDQSGSHVWHDEAEPQRNRATGAIPHMHANQASVDPAIFSAVCLLLLSYRSRVCRGSLKSM